MRFKQYLEYVSAHVPADSEKPTDIVQMLACLIAERLSTTGKLPASCGAGNDLDMDIVQAGILAGLEKIADFDSKLGTMRQFLYPTIVGAMRSYAWERENRVSDSRLDAGLPEVDYAYAESEDKPLPEQLIEETTPETQLEGEESGQAALAAISGAMGALGTEGAAMLLRDAHIGRNAELRQAWADEIGVSIGALHMRLSRLRRDARDWGLTLQ